MCIYVADLPSKKLSLQKIFGSNLHLKSRLAFGNPFKHYASLREARENFANNDLSLILAEPGGFEPPRGFEAPASLAKRYVRPL